MTTKQTAAEPLPCDLPMVWDVNRYRRMTIAEWRRSQAAQWNKYNDFG